MKWTETRARTHTAYILTKKSGYKGQTQVKAKSERTELRLVISQKYMPFAQKLKAKLFSLN